MLCSHTLHTFTSHTNRWGLLLRVGSLVASEARAAVQREAGYRSSAGIATNKMLAKLCSGIHKPDDQTVGISWVRKHSPQTFSPLVLISYLTP